MAVGGTVAGGALGVAASRLRRTAARERLRLTLLAELSGVADGRLGLEETAELLGDLLVPAFADVCIIDGASEGGLRRLAVRASGADAADIQARLRARPPTRPDQPGSGAVARSGRSQLLAPRATRSRAAAPTTRTIWRCCGT